MTDIPPSPQPELAGLSFREQARLHDARLAQMRGAQLAAMNLESIDYHCNKFNVPQSMREGAALNGFRELVRSTKVGLVEPSVKVTDGTPHAARFNLFSYLEDPAAFAASAIRFFEEIARMEEVLLDVASLRLFLDGLQWNAVSRMICGIDLRGEEAHSRVKLWFLAEHQPGAGSSNPVGRALASGLVNDAFHALHVHPSVLVGFDLRFDGTSALKLYPDVWESEFREPLVRERLAKVLSPHSLAVMEDAYWTHLCLAGGNAEARLDLHLKDPGDFVHKWLRHPLALEIHTVYADVPLLDAVAVIPQRELEGDRVENFTLYYTPAGPLKPAG